MTNNANGESSNLTISFESLTPINSNGFCYVKYSFPAEFDLSLFDLDDIVASGMFVDNEGRVTTSVSLHNFEDETQAEKWIVLFGCNFNPAGKSPE